MTSANAAPSSTVSLKCTTTQSGKAVINEIQSQNSFIEAYLLQSANISAWSFWVSGSGPSPVQIKLGQGNCKANGETILDNASNGATTTTWPAGTFIVCLNTSVTVPSKGEVLLVDKQTALAANNTTVIDSINYGNPPKDEWSVATGCSTTYDAHNANNKDIARVPDGTGSLVDNDDESTPGTSNSPVPVTETPGNFNAVDSGGDEVSGVIKTKIAGQAFSLDIHALNSASNATLPSYTGTMSFYLVDASSSGSCGSMTVLQSMGSHTYTGAGSGKDNGVYALSITYANSAPNVKIKMVDSSAGVTACSTDAFAIRPYSLAGTSSAAGAVAATDATWETAGTTRTLNNSSASGGTLHKAGRPFTVRAQSWSATGVATTGYTGTPSLSRVNCTLPASGCVAGTLSAGTVSTSSGLASTSTATYSEVGTITAKLSDSAFAAIDASDGSTLAERTVESAAFTIGRFVPDHFALSTNTPAFAPGCGTFTYLGQPFGFGTVPVWTVTAQNVSNTTTQNYTGTLFKLTGSSITSQTWSAASGSISPVATLPDPTVTDLGLGQASISFDVGNPASGGGLAFVRTAVTAPFDASLTLSASLLDSENVAYASNPYQQSGIGFSDGNAATSTDAQMRFGRLRLSNTFGPATGTLAMSVQAQYWSGASWPLNSDDNCTSLANNAFALSGTLATTTTASAVNLAGGKGSLNLSKSSSATGSVNVAANLGASGPDQSCLSTHAGTAANKPWLRSSNGSCSASTTHTADPSATATFGIYAPEKIKTIHIRELY